MVKTLLSKYTVAEILAVASVFSLTVAVARLIGYFITIDIKLISLIEMRDVIALSFYASSYAIIPTLLGYFFADRAHGDHEELPEGGIKQFLIVNMTRSTGVIYTRRHPFLVINAAVSLIIFIVSLILYGLYWYSERLYFLSAAFSSAVILICIWRAIYLGKYIPVTWLYVAIVTVLSFSYGLNEGQNAVQNPEPNYEVWFSGQPNLVNISRISQSYIFYTTVENEFTIRPLGEIERMRILDPQAFRTNRALIKGEQ